MDSEDSKILQGENRAKLEAALPEYIRGRRWFGGKARRIDIRTTRGGDAAHKR